MRYVALCRNGLSLQPGRGALEEGEFLKVFVELVTKGDLDFGAVAVANVDLHLAVRVNAPFISQAGHFYVVKESGVFTSFILCVNLLNP